MKHQYMTDVMWKITAQRCTDYFVDLYSKYIRKGIAAEETLHATSPHAEPEQILFITLGHLGDALIGSYIFPLLRRRYPNAAIDVLAGEWCSPILMNNPYIRDCIFYDHFRVNRTSHSIRERIWRHATSKRFAVREIREKKYDLSIEGRIHYPNGNLLSYRGEVTRRIGFGSGGYGSLLTNEVRLPSRLSFHLMDALMEELKLLGITVPLESLQPYFTPSTEGLRKPHPYAHYFPKPFIIIHPECGNSKRLVSKEFWLQIVRNILQTTDHTIMICGITQSSSDLSDFLRDKLGEHKERIINTVGKLPLDDFFILSRYAKAAFTLESLAAHFCAINCDTISFYKDGSGALFFPLPNKKSIVIHNHLPSKDAIIHPGIVNYFVEKIESEETTALVAEIIHSMVSKRPES